MVLQARYLVLAQRWGQTAEVSRAQDLAEAWRAAEQLGAVHGVECITILDLEAGILIRCAERTSEPP